MCSVVRDSLGSFEQMWLSKAKYDGDGPSLIHRKSAQCELCHLPQASLSRGLQLIKLAQQSLLQCDLKQTCICEISQFKCTLMHHPGPHACEQAGHANSLFNNNHFFGKDKSVCLGKMSSACDSAVLAKRSKTTFMLRQPVCQPLPSRYAPPDFACLSCPLPSLRVPIHLCP